MGKGNVIQRSAASRAANAAAMLRGEKPVHAAPEPPRAPVRTRETQEPTPEQIGHFVLGPVRTEKGQVIGRAYRRQPYFETLAKMPLRASDQKGPRLITPDQLRALRYYRANHELTVVSETRCALNQERGSGEAIGLPITLLSARGVKDCEVGLGALVHTLRAVALEDKSFAQVAMERWGSRDRQRIVIGSGKKKPRIAKEIVPKSSAHPGIIRQEFLDALKIMTGTTARLVSDGA
jgi:hypothetical protein